MQYWLVTHFTVFTVTHNSITPVCKSSVTGAVPVRDTSNKNISHQHYRYWCCCIGLQLCIELNLNWLQLSIVLFVLNNSHTWFISYISLFRLSISKQLFVPKANLSIGKHAFSVAVPATWNQLPIITIKSSETIATFRKNSKHIGLKLVFYNTLSAVPCSNDDFCLSPFMITPNDYVCCASELEFSRCLSFRSVTVNSNIIRYNGLKYIHQVQVS